MLNLSPTKIELILAAEQIFGERGIEAASLREIASRAEQGNTNAVKYHFDSREGLIEAIFGYRVAQMENPRSILLREAEQQGRLGDARALIEALLLPYLDLRDANGRHSYANFMLQYQRVYLTSIVIARRTPESPVLTELLSHLFTRINFVPHDFALDRIMQSVFIFNSFLVRMDRIGLSDISEGKFFHSMNDAIEMATAAYCAPYCSGYSACGYASGRLFQQASVKP